MKRDLFVECQKSMLTEINQALIELKAQRFEEVYNILTNLSDELTTDIRISEESNFEKIITLGCEEYAKKELSNSDQTNR